MRLYLAGPMRGLPRWNFDAFVVAAAALRAHGYTIFSPAEHDAEVGWSPFGSADPSPDQLARMFTWDLRQVVGRERFYIESKEKDRPKADGVVLLPGWRQSNGAKLEALVAVRCGVQLYAFVPDAPGCMEPIPADRYEFQLTTRRTDGVPQ